MKKLFRSKKALSPVVAAIILIAVTVAVSIAVAAWMGALTFGFMGTEQLTITKVTWKWGASGSRTIELNVNNTGTKDVTINQVQINYEKAIVESPSLPRTLKTGEGVTIKVKYDYTNGTAYDISVVTSSGYKFTDQFIGGQNEG